MQDEQTTDKTQLINEVFVVLDKFWNLPPKSISREDLMALLKSVQRAARHLYKVPISDEQWNTIPANNRIDLIYAWSQHGLLACSSAEELLEMFADLLQAKKVIMVASAQAES